MRRSHRFCETIATWTVFAGKHWGRSPNGHDDRAFAASVVPFLPSQKAASRGLFSS